MMGDLIIDDINGYYDHNLNACQPSFALYGVIASSIVDFALSIITLILFLRPLIKLNKLHAAPETKPIEYHVRKSQHGTTDKSYDVELQLETSIDLGNGPSLKLKKSETDHETITKIIGNNSSSNPNSPRSLQLPTIGGIPLQISTESIGVIDEEIPTPVSMERKKTDTLSLEMGTIQGTHIVPSSSRTDHSHVHPLANRGESRRSITRMKKKKKKTKDSGFDELIARYALLVIISIISSVVFHVTIPLTSWSTDLWPIDDAINVWCIIFTNKANYRIYRKVCCCCNKMIKACV